MGEWAPPFSTSSSPTPLDTTARSKAWGGDEAGVNANHSYLQWHKGTGKNARAGQIAPSPYQLTAGNDKTQRKALQILGVWCFIGLCK